MFFLHGYMCTTCMPGVHRGQKRVQRPWNWSYCDHELPCRCWESNPGSLSFFALLFGGVFMSEQSNSPYTFSLLPVVPKCFELIFLSLTSHRELFPFYSQTKHLWSTEFFHNISPTQPILRSYTLCYLKNSLSALQYQASSEQRQGLACPGCPLFDSMSRLDFWMKMWWTQGSQTVQVATEIVSKLENLSYKSASSVDRDSKQIQWMLLEYHILIVSILWDWNWTFSLHLVSFLTRYHLSKNITNVTWVCWSIELQGSLLH